MYGRRDEYNPRRVGLTRQPNQQGNRTMNKPDLIDHITVATGWTKADATKALEATLSGIKAGLANDENVTLIGFGTFSVTERAARLARNPRTGEEIEVAAARVPKFKPGSDLKALVN
ncbi:HU family DNA-binding protein [Ralstonia insidiosa]